MLYNIILYNSILYKTPFILYNIMLYHIVGWPACPATSRDCREVCAARGEKKRPFYINNSYC